MRISTLAGLSFFVFVGAAVPMSGSAGPAPTAPQSPDAEIRAQPPGEGVLCGWAFLVAAREVGRRCFAGQDAEFQAALQDSVSRLDAYAARNGPLTPSQIADFHKRMGKEGAATAEVCQGDLAKLYGLYRSVGGAAVRSMTDAFVARPGRPTWGDCT